MEVKLILNFIKKAGVKVRLESIRTETFFPGMTISNGTLVVDVDQVKHPGDLLHEAGHIAVTPKAVRTELDSETGSSLFDEGSEIAAIAWSYAACKYLEIDPHFVFHEEAYNGQGNAIVNNFEQGSYFGVQMLQWHGMTFGAKGANVFQVDPFPHMVNWSSVI